VPHDSPHFERLFRFIAPTARKALAVKAEEAVVTPHPTIAGLFHVKLFYYFNAMKRKNRGRKRRGQQVRP
jgi:hypothetical protein